MNYKELVDPELQKSAKSFPFNKTVIAAGNVLQEKDWRKRLCALIYRRLK